jgi:hypothetical protein
MTRTPLPARRIHETLQLQHWSMHYTVGLGRSDQNAPVTEVFINCGRSGEQSETLASDSAVLLSIALQYGVPIEVLQHAITRDPDGKPSGPIGAIIDLIAGD